MRLMFSRRPRFSMTKKAMRTVMIDMALANSVVYFRREDCFLPQFFWVVEHADEAIALLEKDDAPVRAIITVLNLAEPIDRWDVARRASELTTDLLNIFMACASDHE
jgi:hypothetical protein